MYFVTKNGLNIRNSILKHWKGQKYFYGSFHSSLVLLTKFSCLKKNKSGHTKGTKVSFFGQCSDQ